MAEKSDKEKISPKKLEKMWKKVNIPCMLAEAAEKAYPEIEAYRRARAKSRGTNQVFSNKTISNRGRL